MAIFFFIASILWRNAVGVVELVGHTIELSSLALRNRGLSWKRRKKCFTNGPLNMLLFLISNIQWTQGQREGGGAIVLSKRPEGG